MPNHRHHQMDDAVLDQRLAAAERARRLVGALTLQERWLAAGETSDERLLDLLAAAPESIVRQAAAGNPALSAAAASQLALFDPEIAVRLVAAGHPALEAGTVDALVGREQPKEIRARAARHPRLPETTALRLLQYDADGREAVMRNPGARRMLVEYARIVIEQSRQKGDRDVWTVIELLVRTPDLPVEVIGLLGAEILRVASTPGSWTTTRCALIERPQCPADLRDALVQQQVHNVVEWERSKGSLMAVGDHVVAVVAAALRGAAAAGGRQVPDLREAVAAAPGRVLEALRGLSDEELAVLPAAMLAPLLADGQERELREGAARLAGRMRRGGGRTRDGGR